MHVLISAAAPHAGHVGIPHTAAVVVVALAMSVAVRIGLGIIGRIFGPKQKKTPQRQSYSYTAPDRRR